MARINSFKELDKMDKVNTIVLTKDEVLSMIELCLRQTNSYVAARVIQCVALPERMTIEFKLEK